MIYSDLFMTEAVKMSRGLIWGLCEEISHCWSNCIIVTNSQNNKDEIIACMPEFKPCTCFNQVCSNLKAGNRMIMTYHMFFKIISNCKNKNLKHYHVIFLNSKEIITEKTIKDVDFKIAIKNGLMQINDNKIEWINQNYVGVFTGDRILCENNLLRIKGVFIKRNKNIPLHYDWNEIKKLCIDKADFEGWSDV